MHVVPRNDKQSNTQCDGCAKTPELKRMMQAASLAGVWETH